MVKIRGPARRDDILSHERTRCRERPNDRKEERAETERDLSWRSSGQKAERDLKDTVLAPRPHAPHAETRARQQQERAAESSREGEGEERIHPRSHSVSPHARIASCRTAPQRVAHSPPPSSTRTVVDPHPDSLHYLSRPIQTNHNNHHG